MAGSNHKVNIIVAVNDLASRALRNIQNAANSMNRGFGNAGTMFGAFNRNLDSVIGKMDRLATSMYRFNLYTSNLQRNIRTIGLVGGALGAGVAIQGTKNALDFDYKSRIMQSRMEVSDAVRKEINDYVINDLNYKVSFKPTQIADMGIILGQAGIDSSKDMKTMMRSVSYFAEAVDAVPEEAAKMLINAVKGFELKMENSSQVTDKLTVALNKSLLEVDELPHAIGQLSGRANMFGQSLDSSLVALMTMKDQGISAAQGAQDLIHGLRQASRIGNDQVLYERTLSYFTSLGVSNAIFDKDTRRLKEFPELIADMEKAMIGQGFVNPKYKDIVKDDASFREYLKNNGGTAPKDFWDAERAMPLISRVFGAAGQIPIIAGLQTKYEEVNKETGQKTGEVFYGSEALKKMYEDVKNSDGAVDRAHDIISQSGKFQLEVLGGAWEAAQIKLLDGIVPIIKTGAEELTKFFGGNTESNNRKFGQPADVDSYVPKTSLEKFSDAIKTASDNFKKEGNPTMASIVDTVGTSVVKGVQISSTMPPLAKQIYETFNKDIVQADWGSNIIEFPWALVKNGIKFISDLVSANEQFDAAVKKLPEDLQDPAKLVETLVKGGIVLLVTGAIVKVIELAVRGVSLALKGTKVTASLTKAIVDFITGKGGTGGKDNPLGSNMNIKANIVNVYGPTGGAGGKGGPPVPVPGGGPPTPPTPPAPVPLLTRLAGMGTWVLKYGLPTAVATDIMIGANGGPSVVKNIAQSDKNPLNNNSEKKIDEMYEILKDPSKNTIPKNTELVPESSFFKLQKPVKEEPAKLSPAMDTQYLKSMYKDDLDKSMTNFEKKMNDMLVRLFGNTPQEQKTNTEEKNFLLENAGVLKNTSSSIVDAFNTQNSALQNMKVQNAISVMVQPPQVNVSGNMAEFIKVSSTGSSSFVSREGQNGTAWERMNAIGQRRVGWR